MSTNKQCHNSTNYILNRLYQKEVEKEIKESLAYELADSLRDKNEGLKWNPLI